MRWWKRFLTIRWKITFWMFLLVLVSQVISAVVFRSVADDAIYRGVYLEKHLKRFNDDWRRQAEALIPAALTWGTDAEVVAALRAAAGAGAGAGAASEPANAAKLKERYAVFASHVHPALFAVIDRKGSAAFIADGSPLAGDDLPKMKFAASALTTEVVAPVMLNGRLLVMAGAPIRDAGRDVVGAVLLGNDMAGYMNEFSKDSDVDETKRHVLTFVAEDKVVVSSAPEKSWNELAVSLTKDKRLKRPEGTHDVEAIGFGGLFYDVFEEDLNGFAGDHEGRIGKLVIIRNRTSQEAKQQSMLWRAAAVLAGSLVFALLLGYLLSRWIARPVDRLIRATNELAKGGGDLTARLDASAHDELGHLARNMNQMFDNLRELAMKIQGTALQVGASSAQISAASKQMLAGASDQTTKIEDSSAAVTELSSSIQSVAENATNGIRVAREGGDSVNKAIEGMNRIRATVEDASAKIRELGESGKKIGNIVSVIQQISEQTSLLALNAAIEAARAGEQGRGFAVVADEVGQLAKRVGKSAKDIEALIGSIKEQTETSVTTMQAGNRETETGASLVNDTLRHLTAIIETVQETAHSVKEQAIVSDAIARNMEEVRRISHDMLNASKEAVVQGENLHALAVGLEESVKGFKLSRQVGGVAHGAAGSLGGVGAAAARRRDADGNGGAGGGGGGGSWPQLGPGSRA